MTGVVAGRLPAFYPGDLFESGFDSATQVANALTVYNTNAGNAFFPAGLKIVSHHICDFTWAKSVQIENPVHRNFDGIVVFSHR